MALFGKRKKETGKGKEKTRIVVRYNAGYSNNLFIRGSGAGLSWDHGVMLKNIGPDEWIWEPNGPCDFKVLINDQQYESGENHHVDDGVAVQYTPNF